uniref:Short salivary D7 protein n=1 Tax=Simulium guianense TaxID=445764 RepID=F5GTW6_SIMGU
MKFILYWISMIVAVSSDGARSPVGVELVCDKSNDCLNRCYIIFVPYNVFDPEREIYQEKYIACVKEVEGKRNTCEDAKQVQKCFLQGLQNVLNRSTVDQERHEFYWRTPRMVATEESRTF